MNQPTASVADKPLRPAVPFLSLPDNGAPHFEGLRCGACGETFLRRRAACPKCLARDSLATVALSDTGALYTWTVVRRSFPGIAVPYISVVVDLDGGGCVKGNLIHLSPESEALRQGLAVEAVFDQAPYGDKEGNQYMVYYFQPQDPQLRAAEATS